MVSLKQAAEIERKLHINLNLFHGMWSATVDYIFLLASCQLEAFHYIVGFTCEFY